MGQPHGARRPRPAHALTGLDVGAARAYTLGVLPRLLLALCLAVAASAGQAPINPFDQAEVVLYVRDGRWVDREATRFAAAYGGDLALVRGELARVLFRAHVFDGIDLTRPAVIAWRTGPAPLLCAIPIVNRAAFLNAFGAVTPDEPPLVRTGERDGTVIYRQNQPGGEWEYRLLVANNVAYVARTVDECKRLAMVGIPPVDPFAPPIEVSLRGQALLRPRLPGAHWFAALPPLPVDLAELAALPAMTGQAWSELSSQVASLSLTARSDSRGALLLAARLAAKPDSPLALWIGSQRPGTERLAGQIRTPATAFLATGRLAFQGQLERWSFEQVELLRAAAGARWNESVDAAFRSLCTLIERAGASGIAVEGGPAGLGQFWVIEHPRASEVMHATAQLAAALRGVEPESLQVGRLPALGLAGAKGTSVFVSGDRHVARVDGQGGRSAPQAAGQLLQRLDEPGSLDAAPSLVSLWADLALAWNAPPKPDGAAADPVVVTGALRPAGPIALELATEVPLADLGRLLGRLNRPASPHE